MARNVVRAVLVLIAGLACSACGSFLLNGVPSGSGTVTSMTLVQPLQVVHQLPLSRIGTGSQSLGTYAVHGNVRIRATCVGTGKLEIVFTQRHSSDGMGGVRCLGDNTLALNSESNLGVRGGSAQIKVQAPAHMKWWIDVVDRRPKF